MTVGKSYQRSQVNNPPAGVHDWEFSLPRETIMQNQPRFRFRLPHEMKEWRCDRLAGRAEVVATDGKTGRMTLRGKLAIDDGVASMWPAKDAEPDEQGASGQDSHWRLCYARDVEGWRLRDERTGSLTIVKDYKGIVNLNWFDGGTHVFHDGKTIVIDGVCHFGD